MARIKSRKKKKSKKVKKPKTPRPKTKRTTKRKIHPKRQVQRQIQPIMRRRTKKTPKRKDRLMNASGQKKGIPLRQTQFPPSDIKEIPEAEVFGLVDFAPNDIETLSEPTIKIVAPGFPRPEQKQVQFEPESVEVKFAPSRPIFEERQVSPQRPPPIQVLKQQFMPLSSHTLIPVDSLDRKSCELKFNEFLRGKQIGAGSYGRVYELCKETMGETRCPYVLKYQKYEPRDVLIRHDIMQASSLKEIETQIYVHEKLKFTPAVYDYWICKTRTDSEKRFFTIMERLDGSLLSYLYQNRPTRLFVNKVLKQLRQMLAQVHGLGITHNDFAARNIFYKRTAPGRFQWYIGDWGFARRPTIDRQKDTQDFLELVYFLEGLQTGYLRLPPKRELFI